MIDGFADKIWLRGNYRSLFFNDLQFDFHSDFLLKFARDSNRVSQEYLSEIF